jgi:hypothetical protein
VRTASSTDSARARRSIDVLLERYVWWREECNAVEQTYQWWSDCDGGRRALAYAAYRAALDREERAASAYARQIERVSRRYI